MRILPGALKLVVRPLHKCELERLVMKAREVVGWRCVPLFGILLL